MFGAFLVWTAGTTMAASSPLVQHLVAQNAPKAAARLARFSELETAGGTTPDTFEVAASSITLINDASMVSGFVAAARSAIDGGMTLAFDVEWRPDVSSRRFNLPSLLQLATADGVWLLDLEAHEVVDHPDDPLGAVAEWLAAPGAR